MAVTSEGVPGGGGELLVGIPFSLEDEMIRYEELCGLLVERDGWLLWGCLPICTAQIVVDGYPVGLLAVGSVALALRECIDGRGVRLRVHPFVMNEQDALYYGFQADAYYQVERILGRVEL